MSSAGWDEGWNWSLSHGKTEQENERIIKGCLDSFDGKPGGSCKDLIHSRNPEKYGGVNETRRKTKATLMRPHQT
jgi:hypothetical protein